MNCSKECRISSGWKVSIYFVFAYLFIVVTVLFGIYEQLRSTV